MTIHRSLLEAAAAIALICFSPTRAAEPPAQPASLPDQPIAAAVLGVTIPVSDLDSALDFYTRVLTFEKISEREAADRSFEHLEGTFGARARFATLRLGQEQIELVQYLAPEGRPIPADSRSNDTWFQHIAIVVSDIDAAYAHLRANKVRHASTGPQTLPASIPAAAGISAFYFKDPDGHVLEIIHFPAGKGDPRWQSSAGKLFLGIDHTAVVTSDTDRSLAFYQGKLGFQIAGISENFGDEQEHLNNVFGARLRITALRAGTGPGIELLDYLAPRDGRPYPLATKASDLWAWQTRIESFSPASLDDAAVLTRSTWISPGIVPNGIPMLPNRRAFLARDPDGHALLLTEPQSRESAAAHE